MIYLHEAVCENGRVRHWANEIESGEGSEFEKASYRIRQMPTDILYDDAADVIPCKYTYEETDIPIEHEGQEVSDDAVFHRTGEFPAEQ